MLTGDEPYSSGVARQEVQMLTPREHAVLDILWCWIREARLVSSSRKAEVAEQPG